jgi:hypothetical protein
MILFRCTAVNSSPTSLWHIYAIPLLNFNMENLPLQLPSNIINMALNNNTNPSQLPSVSPSLMHENVADFFFQKNLPKFSYNTTRCKPSACEMIDRNADHHASMSTPLQLHYQRQAHSTSSGVSEQNLIFLHMDVFTSCSRPF